MTGISASWSNMLDLGGRVAPELITSIEDIPPSIHADIIRLALTDFKVSAVFCVEGVPTVAIVEARGVDVAALHRILWSQGVFSLLLVLDGTTALSLSLSTAPNPAEGEPDNRLVETLDYTVDAIRLANLFRSIESGRYWMEHERHFRAESRIDQVLLSNLIYAFHQLKEEMGTSASQALLMQTMFVAYVEDRGIISPTYFLEASLGLANSFSELLERGVKDDLERLFRLLSLAFNGGVFLDPVSFNGRSDAPVRPSALRVLARFRRGFEVMETGQYRFWEYDFRYIPIALISAVYDRFLGNESEMRKKHGAFYTPAFLVDVVVDQVWEQLPSAKRASGTFMDPACGSGIFLVRLFQRIVAHKRAGGESLSWDDLVSIVERLYGADIDPAAVKITAFSLYIALLEQMDPREIAELTKRGHILPPLLGKTLHAGCDFITAPPFFVDAILGNPPWKGRPGVIVRKESDDAPDEAEKDGDEEEDADPVPAKDIAWRFIWQSLQCVGPDGIIGLLLPAMGVLHNPSSAKARTILFARARVTRVINFSDLVFELFDGANRPTCLILFAKGKEAEGVYSFDYWVPKSEPGLRLKRMILLPHSDQLRMRSASVGVDAGIFKRRLWTRSSDERLFDYLKTFPSIGKFISQFKNARSGDDGQDERGGEWVIGQGFKFALKPEKRPPGYVVHIEPKIADYPFYSAKNFRALGVHYGRLMPPADVVVHRVGFVQAFDGPYILIPQGIVREEGRLRASYGDRPVSFNSSLQAIVFPKNEVRKAKLLTAILNSRLAAWFFFHSSAYMGTDRAKVIQKQLLQLPFDDAQNMPKTNLARRAEEHLVNLIDQEIMNAKYINDRAPDHVWYDLDELVAQYYGLDDEDITIINDTFEYIIPAMQPRFDRPAPELWQPPCRQQRENYVLGLCRALKRWVEGGVSARLLAKSPDYILLKLTFDESKRPEYREDSIEGLREAISRIGDGIGIETSRNLQLVPDLRIAIGRDLYLVKPNRIRDWLESYAQADADDIAADLLSWSVTNNERLSP
jgi:N-6 DNA Methylase